MKEYEIKLQRYNKKVFGLKAYMFFWLPLLLLSSVWGVYSHVTDWSGGAFDFIIATFSAMVGVWSIIVIRWLDIFSFRINVAFLILCATRYTVSNVSLILAASSLSNTMKDAITDTTASGGYAIGQNLLASGISMGAGFVMFGAIFSLLLFLLFFFVYFHMFFKHKNLFFEY